MEDDLKSLSPCDKWAQKNCGVLSHKIIRFMYFFGPRSGMFIWLKTTHRPTHTAYLKFAISWQPLFSPNFKLKLRGPYTIFIVPNEWWQVFWGSTFLGSKQVLNQIFKEATIFFLGGGVRGWQKFGLKL